MFPAGVVVEAAAGASLLFALAYGIGSSVRRAATCVGLAHLGARLRSRPDEVVLHPVRAKILQLVRGQSAMRHLAALEREAAQALGVSRRNVNFHVRTLHAHHHLAFVRVGNRLYVGPNGGSMGNSAQRVGAGLLHDPVRLELARFLCHRNQGALQREVIAHLRAVAAVRSTWGRGVSRNAVAFHLRKLEEARETIGNRVLGAAPPTALTGADPARLVTSGPDDYDKRSIRYVASPLLHDLVRVYDERSGDLGAGLEELTHGIPTRPNPMAPSGVGVDSSA